MFRLNQHFKLVHSSFNQYLNLSGNTLSTTIAQYKSLQTPFTNVSLLPNYYGVCQSHIYDCKNALVTLQELVIQPLDLFYKNLNSIYTENLDEFHNMQTSVMETKSKLERAKEKYIESARLLASIDQSGDPDKETMLKALALKDNNEKIYQYEVSQANNLFNMYNKKHNNMFIKLKSNEESRIAFIKDVMTKFAKSMTEIEAAFNNYSKNVKNILENVNIEKDMEIIKKEFHFSLYGERFQKEEFEVYNPKKDQGVPIKKIQESGGQVPFPSLISSKALLSSQDDFLTLFINRLFEEKEVEVQQIGQIMELLYMNEEFSKEFIDYFFSTKKTSFYIFYNLNNLQHLANIFNAISFNFEKKKELYDINFALIFIAEKTYCWLKEKNEKIFLCALLSQNKFYGSNAFWNSLIEFKLARKLEEHLAHLMKIDIVKSNDEGEKKNFFSKQFSSLKNVIKGAIKKDLSSTDKSKQSLLEEVQISKQIKNYKQLPEYKKPFLDQFAANELHIILKEFIIHICNFNFSNEKAIDLIIEISNKYKLPNEKMNYYVANISAWLNSSKRHLSGDERENSLNDKIQNLKQKRYDLINVKFPITDTASMKKEQKKIILVHTSKYLSLSNIIPIISLERFMYTKARMKIFKEVLKKENLSLQNRLNTWKCILNITLIKKEYPDYKGIVSKLEEPQALQSGVLDIIKMDVKRTSFAEKEDEYKEMLTNILKAIAYCKPKLNYCQGMNFITSFLLQLTQNESQTFYLMMGIIEKTEFASMFIEDLSKLKSFFFIFERLIAILIPEAFYSMKISNVNVNCFSPAWFITLFTNACTIVDINNPPKVVLRIWDIFFLKGWKGLIATGLAIIKRFEEKIKALQYDQILHFLLSDVIKSDFFKNEKYELFIKEMKSIKINKKLIADLGAEYTFELKENQIK